MGNYTPNPFMTQPADLPPLGGVEFGFWVLDLLWFAWLIWVILVWIFYCDFAGVAGGAAMGVVDGRDGRLCCWWLAVGGVVGFGWWLCWALGLFTVVREKGGRETLMRERERERERERY